MAQTPVQPNISTQDIATRCAYQDANYAVFSRLAGAFAPHAQDTPNMTVRIDAGFVPEVAATATEVAAQNTGTITAPSGNPRYDIVYIDQSTGAVGVATGSEAASPSDPSVPAGKVAVARIELETTTTEITNADITDLRNLTFLGLGDMAGADKSSSAQAEAGTDDATIMTPLKTAEAIAALAPSSIPSGYISGLVVSNNSTDAEHDIDVATGVATDSTGANLITLSAGLTKQLDVEWAAGDDAGGMQSGSSLPTSGYVDLYLIKGSSGVDVIAVPNGTGLSAPTGYDSYYRKLLTYGILTDASANIRSFRWDSGLMILPTPIQDITSTSVPTSATAVTTSAPAGSVAYIMADMRGDGFSLYVADYDSGDTIINALGYSSTKGSRVSAFIRVDASSRVKWFRDSGTTSVTGSIYTYGWLDSRN